MLERPLLQAADGAEGICIRYTMPGFPDKFMPFMNQPAGSFLSSASGVNHVFVCANRSKLRER
jgi:hypothetical protein